MQKDQDKTLQTGKMPPAETGNASNPSPHQHEERSHQILNERAEKYLREVSSIEDEPDAQDQENMDKALKENNKE